jgi:hypothetical protein
MIKTFCSVGLVAASLMALPLAAPAGAQQASAWQVITVPIRPGATMSYLGMAGSKKPVAAVVLLAGGRGVLGLGQGGSIGTDLRLNFLVRSRELFARHGFYVAVLDAPSDREEGMNGVYRLALPHARELGQVIAHLKGRLGAPVWLVATSGGTLSAVNAAARLPAAELPRPDGIVISSSITELTPYCGNTVYDAPLAAIRGPVLVVTHRDDDCVCSPGSATAGHRLIAALAGTSAKAHKMFTGGLMPISGPCAARAAHGFFGIEERVVESIADWIRAH